LNRAQGRNARERLFKLAGQPIGYDGCASFLFDDSGAILNNEKIKWRKEFIDYLFSSATLATGGF